MQYKVTVQGPDGKIQEKVISGLTEEQIRAKIGSSNLRILTLESLTPEPVMALDSIFSEESVEMVASPRESVAPPPPPPPPPPFSMPSPPPPLTPRADDATRRNSVIGAIGGALVGLLLVRYFLFAGIEEFAWRMFWSGIGHGEMIRPDVILQSTTFWKSVAGLVVGGFSGFFLMQTLTRKKSFP
jgi:hypothetical protein